MRKVFAVVVLVLCLAGSAHAKVRMTIRQFQDETEDGKAPAGAVMSMMVTELNKTGLFELVEREALNYIADEISLGQSGLMDMSTAPQIGKVRGAQYSMTGAITLYYYEEKASGIKIPIIGTSTESNTAYVMLEIRIIDNSTSTIVYSANRLGTAKRGRKGSSPFGDIFIGKYTKSEGGILGSATREAVEQHVAAIKEIEWE